MVSQYKASRRVQVTVPTRVADKWEVQADLAGVSLSNWIAMMVAREDTADLYKELLSRTDIIRKYLGDLIKASASTTDDQNRYLEAILAAVNALVQSEGESE